MIKTTKGEKYGGKNGGKPWVQNGKPWGGGMNGGTDMGGGSRPWGGSTTVKTVKVFAGGYSFGVAH